jgi:hypothetical protein
MTDQMQNQSCRNCGKQLKGRSDKKFCNDYCRNHFNNCQKAGTNQYIRKVNNALRKNRKILENLLGNNESCIVDKPLLLEHGFLFHYFTQVIGGKGGKQFYLCYEFGYSNMSHGIRILGKGKIKNSRQRSPALQQPVSDVNDIYAQ